MSDFECQITYPKLYGTFDGFHLLCVDIKITPKSKDESTEAEKVE